MQLSVPNRTAPKSGSFDSRPSSVKDWIDHLPMGNVGETTRLLFEALTELNQQDIPVQQRFKALEMLRRPVHFVSEAMKKHFVGWALPLTEKNLKIARLSRELTHALATGYKVIVMEQIAGVGRTDKKLLITCIHRSIRLLSQVLLKAYQVYEAYPGAVWLEIHSLYRHAEGNGLHTINVPDEYFRGRKSSTIDDAYKQILLLALACPYRLRHGEVESVYQVLEEWAPLCDVQRVGENGTTLFSTNLDTDQPPSYLVLRKANENRSACRALNTVRLAERVRKTLADIRAHHAPNIGNICADTLRHLMLAWGIMPKRRFSRTREHADVIVSMGLSSVHYFVSGEFAFSEAAISHECRTDLRGADQAATHFNDRARFQARPTGETDGLLPDVWEMDYRIEGEAAPSTVEMAVARAASGLQIDTNHRTQSWKMVNVSAGGYCLLWDNLETTRSQVGELLGIREESNPDTFHWRLGVIRWLKYADKRGLELGVQMLSPGAVAIAGRPEKSPANDEHYMRGLLLPEVASLQQEATLLLPSPPFRAGATAVINCQGKNIQVRLTKLVENTGSFAQFQFESLGEVDPPRPKKSVRKPVSGDFDDVWELL